MQGFDLFEPDVKRRSPIERTAPVFTLNVRLQRVHEVDQLLPLHRAELGDLVVELTNSGMDYCFLKPLLLAKVGFVVQQSANLGVAGATRIMAPMIRNIIARLDRRQLLVVADYIRHLMGTRRPR